MTTITQHNRRESETTEYDCSTDDESLRFLMSETDQVDNEDDQDDDDEEEEDEDGDDEDGDDEDDSWTDNDKRQLVIPTHPVRGLFRALQSSEQLWQPAQPAHQVQNS